MPRTLVNTSSFILMSNVWSFISMKDIVPVSDFIVSLIFVPASLVCRFAPTSERCPEFSFFSSSILAHFYGSLKI